MEILNYTEAAHIQFYMKMIIFRYLDLIVVTLSYFYMSLLIYLEQMKVMNLIMIKKQFQVVKIAGCNLNRIKELVFAKKPKTNSNHSKYTFQYITKKEDFKHCQK